MSDTLCTLGIDDLPFLNGSSVNTDMENCYKNYLITLASFENKYLDLGAYAMIIPLE